MMTERSGKRRRRWRNPLPPRLLITRCVVSSCPLFCLAASSERRGGALRAAITAPTIHPSLPSLRRLRVTAGAIMAPHISRSRLLRPAVVTHHVGCGRNACELLISRRTWRKFFFPSFLLLANSVCACVRVCVLVCIAADEVGGLLPALHFTGRFIQNLWGFSFLGSFGNRGTYCEKSQTKGRPY